MSERTLERPGKRSIGDVIGGFVAGLYSVPEGIGYASLAGINPMFGMYAGMVPVAVAAATTGSVLMMSTPTSAIALTTAELLDRIGAQNVLPGDPHVGGALEVGLLRGRALLAELRATGRPLGS